MWFPSYPDVDVFPPVHSRRRFVMRSKVALLATFSGCVHDGEGHTSGYLLGCYDQAVRVKK